jgi:hypothetical protein
MTAAGRSVASPTRPAPASPPGHRRKLRQPARSAPRRLSGPVRGRYRPTTAPRTSARLGAQALAVVRSLPEHSLIDRLVRGRAWIPVLGVLLAGIVAMQVEVLKLGTGMGRALERGSTLQSQNELLQASVATLADDQRIERLAAGMGMVMPPPTALSFLSAKPDGNVGQAIGNIHTPDSTGFASVLDAQLAASASAAAAASSPPVTTSATPGPSSSASSTTSPTTSQTPTTTTTPSGGGPATTTGTAQSSAAPSSTPSGAAPAAQGPATGAAPIAPAGSSQTSSSGGG